MIEPVHTSLVYNPPPVTAIPILHASDQQLRYVAQAHPFHWVQPEHPYQRGYYYEAVPTLEDPDLCYGIHIEICPAPGGDLLLSAEACEPGGARRQMNFRRLFRPANVQPVGSPGRDTGLYDHLKSLVLLRWLPETRLLMMRALQMTDPKERFVMRCIHGKEGLSLTYQDDPSRFTPEQLADRCGWYLPKAGRRRVPDSERVLPYLKQLIDKQLLVEHDGEYHTPEYVVDRVAVVLYAPVIPHAEWLALCRIPGVMESSRPAGAGGRAWLQDLLKEGRE